ncbi:MAG: hypothetical protein ACTTIZ_06660 [Treponema sp.]
MKKLFWVMPAVLLAVFMATSCNQGGGGQALNSEQQKAYDSYVSTLAMNCANMEIPANVVASGLQAWNLTAKTTVGIIVEDTQAGKPIAQGTSKEALKKRFKAKKA